MLVEDVTASCPDEHACAFNDLHPYSIRIGHDIASHRFLRNTAMHELVHVAQFRMLSSNPLEQGRLMRRIIALYGGKFATPTGFEPVSPA